MIVLDTNIASVILSPHHPDLPTITAWQSRCPDQDFRITAVTRAELSYGIALLPEGDRKHRLSRAVRQFLDAMEPWTLPFGAKQADVYGLIAATRRAQGLPISVLDAQIAATAMQAGAVVATRNVADFSSCGVGVIDPYAPVNGPNAEGGTDSA